MYGASCVTSIIFGLRMCGNHLSLTSKHQIWFDSCDKGENLQWIIIYDSFSVCLEFGMPYMFTMNCCFMKKSCMKLLFLCSMKNKQKKKTENRVGTTWSWTSYDCILIWAFKIKLMCLLPPKLTFIQVSVVREELNGLHPTVRSDSCTQSPKRDYFWQTEWNNWRKPGYLPQACCAVFTRR